MDNAICASLIFIGNFCLDACQCTTWSEERFVKKMNTKLHCIQSLLFWCTYLGLELRSPWWKSVESTLWTYYCSSKCKEDEFVMKKLIYGDNSEDNEEADKFHIQLCCWQFKSFIILLLLFSMRLVTGRVVSRTCFKPSLIRLARNGKALMSMKWFQHRF